MIFLLTNIGHFQVLVIYEGIHRNQVFWHQKVGQTLLYWYQLRNLTQICAKILHTRFPIVVLLGKSSIFQLLLQFDEKIRNFAQNLWSHFSVFFHTVAILLIFFVKLTHFDDFDRNLSKCVGFTKFFFSNCWVVLKFGTYWFCKSSAILTNLNFSYIWLF